MIVFSLVTLLVCALALPLDGRAAAAAGRTEIASSTIRFGNFATDGRYVVWDVEQPSQDFDVYAYDLVSGETFAVATGAASQSLIGIDAGRVSWIERDAGAPESTWKLVAKTLPSGETVDVTIGSLAQSAVISGGRAAYWDDQGALVVRTLDSSSAPIVIAKPTVYGTSLAFDGDWLAWYEVVGVQQNGSTTEIHWRVLMQKLGESEPRVVDDGWGNNGSVTIDYPRILYAPLAATPDQVPTVPPIVAMLNLDTGQTMRYPTYPNCFAGPMQTDGRYAITNCVGVPPTNSYLWGLDLATSSSFSISVADDALPGYLDVDYAAGTLAWIEQRDDGWHLFVDSIDDLLPSAPRVAPEGASPDWNYSNATGHYLTGGFRTFWRHSGGLDVFGFPMTEEFRENGQIVQYTERQRFEYHPELAGTPYETELGLLGSEDAATRGLLGTAPFAPVANVAAREPSCAHVAATSHTLCGDFRAYWQNHGLDFGDPGMSYRESLALFGYPLSEAFVDPATGLLTQYFERAIFEFHPENVVPYQVQLKLLGAKRLAARGW